MILAAILVCFGGCMIFGGKHDKNIRLIKAEDSDVYGNLIFYQSALELRYQNLNAVSEKGFPIDGETIQDTTSPFKSAFGFSHFVIDIKETKKNKDIPVVIIGGSFYSGVEERTKDSFYSYNAKDGSVKFIAEVPETLSQFYLYGDTILFMTLEFDLGTNIRSIKKNGTEQKMLENPNKAKRKILTVKEDILYYQEGNQIYSVPVDFSKPPTVFMENTYDTTAFFFYGDYVYQNIYSSSDAVKNVLVRTPLSDLTKTEIVLKNITGMISVSGEFIYHPYRETDGHLHIDRNKTYVFHPETEEIELLFENSDSEFYTIRNGFSEKALVYQTVPHEDSFEGFTKRTSRNIMYIQRWHIFLSPYLSVNLSFFRHSTRLSLRVFQAL